MRSLHPRLLRPARPALYRDGIRNRDDHQVHPPTEEGSRRYRSPCTRMAVAHTAPTCAPFATAGARLRIFLLYSPRWLFLIPGLLLILLGLAGYALALPGSTLGGVRFGAHSLLVASLATAAGLPVDPCLRSSRRPLRSPPDSCPGTGGSRASSTS